MICLACPCSGPPPCGSICFTPTIGCGGGSSCVVTVTGPGGFSDTCTTTTGIACCVSIPAAGTYTLTAVVTGFVTFTTTVIATCTTNNVSHTFTLAAGWSCSPFACCDGASQTGPPYHVLTAAWPASVTINDGISTDILPLVGPGAYQGIVSRPASQSLVCPTATGTPVAGNVPVLLSVSCQCGTGGCTTWDVAASCYGCTSTGGGCVAFGGHPEGDIYGYPGSDSSDACGIFIGAGAVGGSVISGCPPGTISGSGSIGFSGVSLITGLHHPQWYVYGNSTTISWTS